MQVRQILASAVLAFTALGAMSQEIDRSESLQGKSVAAQREKIQQAESPQQGRAGQADEKAVVGSQAAAVVSPTKKAPWAARHATHTYAKAWLRGDKRTPSVKAIADLA